ncbi:hypothetical protein AWR36_011475 [Microbulbifer flavimaris]|uniref:Uncharacterized protein n=1 Tax=Microbulbifer flavimaris TaxID=1781068 RepID=A0ABX4HZN4_9GAMM|nr:hypothetical protein AVO43_11450 [Microbulbifer sp. ZGT114]PCO05331.1 hypothetical protein AWR36_011475 [Microbulbifer flavimaris]
MLRSVRDDGKPLAGLLAVVITGHQKLSALSWRRRFSKVLAHILLQAAAIIDASVSFSYRAWLYLAIYGFVDPRLATYTHMARYNHPFE